MLHTVLSLLTGRFDVYVLACCTVKQSAAATSIDERLSSPASISPRVYHARSPFRSERIVSPLSNGTVRSLKSCGDCDFKQ